MSQVNAGDFPIDPQVTSGTALAEILNRWFNAANTQNSGATEPPTTYPGMFWYDTSTTPPVLKIRNAGGTGWVTFAASINSISADGSTPMTGQFKLADGTLGAPGLAWETEHGMGWYRMMTSQRGFAAQGQRVETLDANSNIFTSFTIAPRTAGSSQLTAANQPSGSANYHAIVMAAQATRGILQVVRGGSAAIIPLELYSESQINLTGVSAVVRPVAGPTTGAYLAINAYGLSESMLSGMRDSSQRWSIQMPAPGATGDFVINRYSDAGVFTQAALYIRRSDGYVSIAGSGLGSSVYISIGSNSNNGKLYLVNTNNTTVGEFGVATLTGYGDSIGINVANATGRLDFGTNGTTRIFMDPSSITLQHSRINISSPDFRITGIAVTGSAANLFQDATYGYIYRSSSSAQYKKNIQTLDDSSFIYDLRPVTFEGNTEADKDKGTMYGFISEEVDEVNKAFVSYLEDKPEGVQYDRLVAPIIAEMKKLNQRITQLETA